MYLNPEQVRICPWSPTHPRSAPVIVGLPTSCRSAHGTGSSLSRRCTVSGPRAPAGGGLRRPRVATRVTRTRSPRTRSPRRRCRKDAREGSGFAKTSGARLYGHVAVADMFFLPGRQLISRGSAASFLVKYRTAVEGPLGCQAPVYRRSPSYV